MPTRLRVLRPAPPPFGCAVAPSLIATQPHRELLNAARSRGEISFLLCQTLLSQVPCGHRVERRLCRTLFARTLVRKIARCLILLNALCRTLLFIHITIGFDDTLTTVKEIFDAVKFRHLLVVEEGKLHGVVSDRDLLRTMSPFIGSTVETSRDIATLNKRVHQIMTRKPITLSPEADIADAVQLFLTNQISSVPIVNEEFRPVGIVSWRDILRTLSVEGTVPPSAA
jgi:acetoin utilization protein AcuB